MTERRHTAKEGVRVSYDCHGNDGARRFDASTADPDTVHGIIERDGVVILEGYGALKLSPGGTTKSGAVLDDADPDAELFNPIMKAVHGPCTK